MSKKVTFDPKTLPKKNDWSSVYVTEEEICKDIRERELISLVSNKEGTCLKDLPKEQIELINAKINEEFGTNSDEEEALPYQEIVPYKYPKGGSGSSTPRPISHAQLARGTRYLGNDNS